MRLLLVALVVGLVCHISAYKNADEFLKDESKFVRALHAYADSAEDDELHDEERKLIKKLDKDEVSKLMDDMMISQDELLNDNDLIERGRNEDLLQKGGRNDALPGWGRRRRRRRRRRQPKFWGHVKAFWLKHKDKLIKFLKSLGKKLWNKIKNGCKGKTTWICNIINFFGGKKRDMIGELHNSRGIEDQNEAEDYFINQYEDLDYDADDHRQIDIGDDELDEFEDFDMK